MLVLLDTGRTQQYFSVADIYVCMVSDAHQVCAKGYFLAIVSTTVETGDPEAELQPGLDLLGNIEEKWVGSWWSLTWTLILRLFLLHVFKDVSFNHSWKVSMSREVFIQTADIVSKSQVCWKLKTADCFRVSFSCPLCFCRMVVLPIKTIMLSMHFATLVWEMINSFFQLCSWVRVMQVFALLVVTHFWRSQDGEKESVKKNSVLQTSWQGLCACVCFHCCYFFSCPEKKDQDYLIFCL